MNTIPFNLSHYEKLLPLKKKWETFKVNKVLSINTNEQKVINSVSKELFGLEPSWCCAESLPENIKQVMNPFQKFEQENFPAGHNPVSINQKTFKR